MDIGHLGNKKAEILTVLVPLCSSVTHIKVFPLSLLGLFFLPCSSSMLSTVYLATSAVWTIEYRAEHNNSGACTCINTPASFVF